jgi:DNA-binding CsgD family transcriptional regulator
MAKKIEFTDRELTVMKMICRQLTSQEIGDKLGLSKRTVENYRENLQKKTRAKNVVGIVLFAIKHGHFIPK